MAKGDNAVLPPCKLVTMLYLNAIGVVAFSLQGSQGSQGDKGYG
jgi:hypothetical protein